MELNPQIVFERMFGDGSTAEQRAARREDDRSILDSLIGGLSRLKIGLDPSDLTVFGSEVLFNGTSDAVGNRLSLVPLRQGVVLERVLDPICGRHLEDLIAGAYLCLAINPGVARNH